jgi:hypothetical protein
MCWRLSHDTDNLLKPSGFFVLPPGWKFKNSTWYSLCVECFVRTSEQTANFVLYVINSLVFITVVEVFTARYGLIPYIKQNRHQQNLHKFLLFLHSIFIIFIIHYIDQPMHLIRYGRDGPGIESRWRQEFLHPSRPTLGPTQPPIQWV